MTRPSSADRLPRGGGPCPCPARRRGGLPRPSRATAARLLGAAPRPRHVLRRPAGRGPVVPPVFMPQPAGEAHRTRPRAAVHRRRAEHRDRRLPLAGCRCTCRAFGSTQVGQHGPGPGGRASRPGGSASRWSSARTSCRSRLRPGRRGLGEPACSAGSAPTRDAAPDELGGVVVQQSTEDADAEVWNLVYSDPLGHRAAARPAGWPSS